MSPVVMDGVEYLTVEEAVDYMGCTDGWIRVLCRRGDLAGRKLGERLRLVSKESATRVRESLSTRSNGKKHLARRPVSKRAKRAKRSRRDAK
jgi:excisionase family DNA binding protein